MDQIRNSLNLLRDTAVALSTRAKGFELEIAQNKRELKVKDRTVADLKKRICLSPELVGLAAHKPAVQKELVELEDKLRESTAKVARWEQQVVCVEQDRDQWASLYEETKKHHEELKKDMASLKT